MDEKEEKEVAAEKGVGEGVSTRGLAGVNGVPGWDVEESVCSCF